MSEFRGPRPTVIERELREVNGVWESVVTSAGDAEYSEYLRREKVRLLSEIAIASEVQIDTPEITERVAAD